MGDDLDRIVTRIVTQRTLICELPDEPWEPMKARWKKIYKGKSYTIFCTTLGVPPSKVASYLAANEWWIVKKAEIDSKAPVKPHPMAPIVQELGSGGWNGRSSSSSVSDGDGTKGKDLANSVYAASMVNEKIDVFALGVLLFELLWRFDTKTERFVVLNALTRSGTLPADFGRIIEYANSGSTAHVRSEGGDGDLGPAGVDAAHQEQRQRTYELGDMIARCIAGMVHSDPADRWDCASVKECVERLLQMCECSVQTVV